jgi:predicted nucleic acid-binding protein
MAAVDPGLHHAGRDSDRAAQLPRSLDAIHLATAQVLTNESGTALIAFVTYDRRLLECAKAAGLPIASPGQN